MKWFNDIETLEELKKAYKALAFKHHPDMGGTTADMQAINNAYDDLFQKLKNTHKNANGETYTSKTETPETPEQFKDIISIIIHFENVTIEIIGAWLWISGKGTYQYKDILKEQGFKWSSKKYAWHFHTEPFRKKSKKILTLDEIRDMYGVQSVNTIETRQLAYQT